MNEVENNFIAVQRMSGFGILENTDISLKYKGESDDWEVEGSELEIEIRTHENCDSKSTFTIFGMNINTIESLGKMFIELANEIRQHKDE